jgi:RNA polymerase sigma-70 factor (sigma-E family)
MGCVHGERETVEFSDFARAMAAELHRFGHVLAGNPHDGADLAQGVLERVGKRWTSLQRQSIDPFAYTRKAMINAHISEWRRTRRENLVPEPPDTVTVAARDPFDGDELRRAVGRLPAGQRTVLVLRYYNDMPMIDVARTLGISVGTVKSQSSKAISKLRGVLRPAEPAPQPLA